MRNTYNVFSAALLLAMRRVVWASSETTLGLPFDREQPAYAPIDEQHPLYPESSYALWRVLMGEHPTLLSIAKARAMLGYLPQHSWRDHLQR